MHYPNRAVYCIACGGFMGYYTDPAKSSSLKCRKCKAEIEIKIVALPRTSEDGKTEYMNYWTRGTTATLVKVPENQNPVIIEVYPPHTDGV